MTSNYIVYFRSNPPVLKLFLLGEGSGYLGVDAVKSYINKTWSLSIIQQERSQINRIPIKNLSVTQNDRYEDIYFALHVEFMFLVGSINNQPE